MTNNKKIKYLLFILILLFALITSAKIIKAYAYSLPDIGSPTNRVLSLRDEKLLGDHIYYQIQRQLPIITDPFIEDYIQKLGNKLLQQSEHNFEQFKFFIVNDNSINAFALPGGYIGINRGLFKVAKNEDELAAVIAHEVTHVNQRHIARSIAKQQQLELPMIAGMIAGALLAVYSPEVGQSIIAGSMAASNQSLINYTRSNEIDADNIGMYVLAQSGYNPYSMADMFNNMKQHDYNDVKQFPEYLKTHPVNDKRISDARNRADEITKNNQKNTKNNPDNLDFKLIKNILEIHSLENLKKIPKNLDISKNQLADDLILFNSSYRFLLKQENEKAKIILEKLQQKYPYNNLILSLYAEALDNTKQHKKSLDILEKQIKKHPKNIALNIVYSKIAINNNEISKAIDSLSTITKNYPEQQSYPAQVNFLLAKAYKKNNNEWRAALAFSDYSIQLGDLPTALMQLKATAKYTKLTDYQQKIINYRIKKLEEEFKERQAKLRDWL